ncbi:MAG: hypothetical protein ACOYI9_02960 [Candidatus Hydrogenedentales bacterium]|jgi:hypothetical protein
MSKKTKVIIGCVVGVVILLAIAAAFDEDEAETGASSTAESSAASTTSVSSIEKHGASKSVSISEDGQFEMEFRGEAKRSAAEKAETVDVRALLERFSNFSELQKEKWIKENEWQYVVYGFGEVSEVDKTGWTSEISNAAYQITCEFTDGNRAVVFLDKNRSNFVENLDIGERISFTGKLKTMKDWPFWCTAYVKVD